MLPAVDLDNGNLCMLLYNLVGGKIKYECL